MIYEYQLGEESFWHPYLSLLPNVEFFCNWPEEHIREFQDPLLMAECKEYKDDVEYEWKEVEIILMSYPALFKESVIDRGLFMRIFA